jgi:endonuclease/exonuclease/phosphatase (EEP) superfamily protein YafD
MSNEIEELKTSLTRPSAGLSGEREKFSSHPRSVGQISQRAALAGWITVTAAAAFLAYAHLLPQRLTDEGAIYRRLVAAAFFGQVLTFQIGLAIALLAGIAAILRRWRLAMFSVITAALAILPNTGPVRRPPPVATTGTVWWLMDMNVKYHQGDSPSLLAQIREIDPAVITVEDPTIAFDNEVQQPLAGEYPHHILVSANETGLEVYSRFPFTGTPPRLTFNQVARQLRLELLIDGKPVVLYVVHPFSPRSQERIMSNRIATAALADQIEAEVFPVVAAGDFNFTAETPNQARLESVGLTDAWDLAGRGRGSTWPMLPTWMAYLPGVRIDHVFVSPQLTCTEFKHGRFDGSDHLPIAVKIGCRK